MQREEQAHSPTKSAGDSAVLERVDGGERWRNNPSGSRPNFFGRQHLTFDKGGKCIGNFRGIVRFWDGWCGASGGSAFKRAVGVTVFGATGGASSLPYEKRW